MPAHPTRPLSTDVATEANGLLTGFGILTFALFPFALPGLLLAVAPLALVAMVGLVLAIPVLIPLWVVRAVRRRATRGTRSDFGDEASPRRIARARERRPWGRPRVLGQRGSRVPHGG